MAELFSRKAIAESSSGLHVTDTKPSPTLGSQCPKKNGKTDAPVRIKQESLLFNLPAELRLRIYNLLLVSRPKPWDNSSGSVRKNHQNSVWLDQPGTMLARECRTMHPAILRTCKRIYLEAVPTLYSRNTISFDNPDLMLRLIDRAGRILSKVGVEKLRIEGGYAKPWPAYFRDKFGARVVEAEEDWAEPPPKDPADEKERQWAGNYWGQIRDYYWGTELLNPWEEED